MAKKVGINGFGRIGKVVFRLLQQHSEIEVVGINDPMDLDTMVYLLKYDTVHGRFNGIVLRAEGGIIVNDKFIPVSAESDPEKHSLESVGCRLCDRIFRFFLKAGCCSKSI